MWIERPQDLPLYLGGRTKRHMRRRLGFFVFAADLKQRAQRAYDRLVERPDIKKLWNDNSALSATIRLFFSTIQQNLISSEPTQAESILATYKLWEWAVRCIKQGNDYQSIPHLFDILQQATHWLQWSADYHRQTPDWKAKTWTFEAMEQWVYEMQREANEQSGSSQWQGEKKIFTWPDGWYMAEVPSSDCGLEGELMGHCVGGYGHAIDRGESYIVSLRDPKGHPHVTLEMIGTKPNGYATNGMRHVVWEVQQIQGKSDREPIPEYQDRIKEWFQSLKNEGLDIRWANNAVDNGEYYDDGDPDYRWDEQQNFEVEKLTDIPEALSFIDREGMGSFNEDNYTGEYAHGHGGWDDRYDIDNRGSGAEIVIPAHTIDVGGPNHVSDYSFLLSLWREFIQKICQGQFSDPEEIAQYVQGFYFIVKTDDQMGRYYDRRLNSHDGSAFYDIANDAINSLTSLTPRQPKQAPGQGTLFDWSEIPQDLSYGKKAQARALALYAANYMEALYRGYPGHPYQPHGWRQPTEEELARPNVRQDEKGQIWGPIGDPEPRQERYSEPYDVGRNPPNVRINLPGAFASTGRGDWGVYIGATMRRMAEVEGYTNWDTFETANLISQYDYETLQKARRLIESGATIEQFRDWVLKALVGPYNQERMDEAHEWNSIPEHDRLDHSYEEWKEKFGDDPAAMDLRHNLIGGPDVGDVNAAERMIDPELVNWDEVYQDIKNEMDETANYEREQQNLKDQGLDFASPGHPLETQQMIDAWMKHHGALTDEQIKQQYPGAPYSETRHLGQFGHRMWVPLEHVQAGAGEYNWPQDFNEDLQNEITRNGGWHEPTHTVGWRTLHKIQSGQPSPYIPVMMQALQARGYTPEQIQHITRQTRRYDPETQEWQQLEEPPRPEPPLNLDAPGTMTFPSEWTSKTASLPSESPIVQCAWCKRVQQPDGGYAEADPEGQISHGICTDCFNSLGLSDWRPKTASSSAITSHQCPLCGMGQLLPVGIFKKKLHCKTCGYEVGPGYLSAPPADWSEARLAGTKTGIAATPVMQPIQQPALIQEAPTQQAAMPGFNVTLPGITQPPSGGGHLAPETVPGGENVTMPSEEELEMGGEARQLEGINARQNPYLKVLAYAKTPQELAQKARLMAQANALLAQVYRKLPFAQSGNPAPKFYLNDHRQVPVMAMQLQANRADGLGGPGPGNTVTAGPLVISFLLWKDSPLYMQCHAVLIHEIAHLFQTPEVIANDTLREGGATAFAVAMEGKVWGSEYSALGNAGSPGYASQLQYVQQNETQDWILYGQFGLTPPGGSTVTQTTGTAKVATSMQTSWHITDNPRFAFDPERVGQINSTIGGEMTEPGLFVTQEPEFWFNGHDYVRPFIAEIEHPADLPSGYYQNNDHYLPASMYPQSRIKRVIPIDEYARERWGEPGWIEDFHGDAQPVSRGYRYTGPDVRDMSPEEIQRHYDRAAQYIEKTRRHMLRYWGDDGETPLYHDKWTWPKMATSWKDKYDYHIVDADNKKTCSTCSAFKAGHCRMFYNAKVDERGYCTEWSEVWAPKKGHHASDCAVHNEPAFPRGVCNCHVVRKTADAGLDASQDNWWGPMSVKNFKVDVPGEAPGMGDPAELPGSQNTLKNPCWCDVGPTAPHEWTSVCENSKRPTMEHEAMGQRGDLSGQIEFRVEDANREANVYDVTELGLNPQSNGTYISAWLNGKHIGGVTIEDDGMVGHISVLPEYRRMGVGNALWNYAKEIGLDPQHDWGAQSEEGRGWAKQEDPEGFLDYAELTEPGEDPWIDPNHYSKTAAENVPGMPQADAGEWHDMPVYDDGYGGKLEHPDNWVWLDGRVGWGGQHHEIARNLAAELGYDPVKVNYISNTIARNGVPEAHAVATGTMRSEYPQIYFSTRDRNAIFDDVLRSHQDNREPYASIYNPVTPSAPGGSAPKIAGLDEELQTTTLLQNAENMFGSLRPDLKERVLKFVAQPSHANWEDCRGIIISPPMGSIWQAVAQFDPRFSAGSLTPDVTTFLSALNDELNLTIPSDWS